MSDFYFSSSVVLERIFKETKTGTDITGEKFQKVVGLIKTFRGSPDRVPSNCFGETEGSPKVVKETRKRSRDPTIRRRLRVLFW